MEKLNHIGIILDGNRRFAKRLLLEPWKGHKYGAKKVEKLIEWANEQKIKELTLYCLSVENIKKRPKKELRYLFNLFIKEFKNMDREKINKNKIKIKFIGNLSLLPSELSKECKKLEKNTEKNNKMKVNFAISYGGKQEIIQAIKKIIKKDIPAKAIDENIINKNLYMSSQPDLIIRTGGEKRTSNFLTWQSTYSEWLFLDKMWPEFQKKDLIQAIKEFKKRKRRFGK
jgi:tritrans,polycis-undecaprenyl-diphosphate synthase [geranylgeranyl-diphosphate specific]